MNRRTKGNFLVIILIAFLLLGALSAVSEGNRVEAARAKGKADIVH